jgi:hypothetical protein
MEGMETALHVPFGQLHDAACPQYPSLYDHQRGLPSMQQFGQFKFIRRGEAQNFLIL